jgi:hypothetical protein
MNVKKNSQIRLEYDVCGRCGTLFDDQGENGWWIESGLWWHECDDDQPARIVVRKLARVAPQAASHLDRDQSPRPS